MLLKIENAPQTLRDVVQERMRAAIIEGHFAPGERLVERPLCEQLGVSRTVVRETIRYLEAEGLVEIIANKGPIVATLNWDQAKQIYDIRRVLEAEAAAACAAAQSTKFADRFDTALKDLATTMAHPERSALLQATTTFYGLIFEEAGHDIAWDIVQRLNGRISRLRALTLSATDREKSGMSHMTSIHAAIRAQDPQGARAAVEAHIADAAKTAEVVLRTAPKE